MDNSILKISGIYAIRNIVTDRSYIGSSNHILHRFKIHKKRLRSGTHFNSYLQQSWDKHGEKAFSFFVLEEIKTSRGGLLEAEQRWIDEYIKNNKAYNLMPTAVAPTRIMKRFDNRGFRICNKCGITEDQVEFTKGKNTCRQCFKQIEYNNYKKRKTADPKQFLAKAMVRWNKWLKIHGRPKYIYHTKTRNPRRFLTDQMSNFKRETSINNKLFNLDLDYIESVWNSQNGKCAITGLPMTNNQFDLFAARPVMIDPTKGPIKGNIQIICDGVKRIHQNVKFINEIKNNTNNPSPTLEKYPRKFLSVQLAQFRRDSKKDNIPCDLDKEYIESLWIKQNGMCAIASLKMTHNNYDLWAVRIDIVDPQKGFIKGNARLICDGIKRIGRNIPDDKLLEFINALRGH